jgi:hypothetical protein
MEYAGGKRRVDAGLFEYLDEMTNRSSTSRGD